ncbi:glycosyl transferase [Corallococcus sp. AB049A]|uniref:Glycosyl transferase n=1 Tax=Corallococcus interemptor TaxID=2316720 RepID=A0A3A8QND3_9BACT|nr:MULTISPECIES: macrolide family glycosyltransferase [Corallococcus]RKH50500.1 glycosyl transferase [Corallococcus sp. AB050B]RKH70266.1 glycosyl transferase [Corallococcus interemptor]RKI69560.1 glycosyl transferase [Corallococcus sp. AB049A]
MSRRAHIAMVSIPAHGHVNPSLELIRELVSRGHRVTYANDAAFAEPIARTGAELRPYRSLLPQEGVTQTRWPDDLVGQLDMFLDDAMAMLPQLRAAYEHDRPDLFLYDIGCSTARILGENWGIPAVQLSPSSVAWEGYEQDMAELVEMLRTDPRAVAHYQRYSAWLQECGVAETDAMRFVGKPPRGLVLIPRALQPQADRVDGKRFTFVGPCFGDRSEQGSWQRPPGARKVVLVSLGSTFTNQAGFYRACLAAFGGLPGWHVVLQIGKHVALEELGAIPDNVEVHRWVPQLAVLEQADAFVTHAGMGGSQEGLYCGLPMIAVPQSTDQFSNADQLVALGVARRLDTEDATPDALRSALLQLTEDPAVATRLAALRKELRAEAGAARAAALLEKEFRLERLGEDL